MNVNPPTSLVPCPKKLQKITNRGHATHRIVQDLVQNNMSQTEWKTFRKIMVGEAQYLDVDLSCMKSDQPEGLWKAFQDKVTAKYPFLQLFEDAWPLHATWDIYALNHAHTIQKRLQKTDKEAVASEAHGVLPNATDRVTHLGATSCPSRPRLFVGRTPPKINRTIVNTKYRPKQRRLFDVPKPSYSLLAPESIGTTKVATHSPLAVEGFTRPSGLPSDTEKSHGPACTTENVTGYPNDSDSASFRQDGLAQPLDLQNERSDAFVEVTNVVNVADADAPGGEPPRVALEPGASSSKLSQILQAHDRLYLFERLAALGMADDTRLKQFLRLDESQQRKLLQQHLSDTDSNVLVDVFGKSKSHWQIGRNEHEDWIGDPLCGKILVLKVLRLDGYTYDLLQQQLISDYQEEFLDIGFGLQDLQRWNGFMTKVQKKYPILRDYEDLWAVCPILSRKFSGLQGSESAAPSISQQGPHSQESRTMQERDDIDEHFTLQGVPDLAGVARDLGMRTKEDLFQAACRPELDLDLSLSNTEMSALERFLFKVAVYNL